MNICAHEQQRIACDLHDELGQHLVGVAFRAKLLAQQLTGRHMAEATAVVQLMNEAAKQVRSITRNLDCAEGITDLRTELHKLAIKVRQNCQVTITLNTNGTSLPMNTRAAVQLYRIAQEAVHNALSMERQEQLKSISLMSTTKRCSPCEMTVLALTNKKYAQEWVCESCVTAPIASAAQSIFIHDLVTRRLLVVRHKQRGFQLRRM